MKTAAMDRWFENYEPSSVHEFGSIRVDEEEVLAFGRRFDPQAFSTDFQPCRQRVDDRAEGNPFDYIGFLLQSA